MLCSNQCDESKLTHKISKFLNTSTSSASISKFGNISAEASELDSKPGTEQHVTTVKETNTTITGRKKKIYLEFCMDFINCYK